MRTDFSENPLIQRCIEFSLLAIEYVEQWEHQKKSVIARQLLRSATSIGANAMEAQSAESKPDFHMLNIADNEAHETFYWLISVNSPKHIHSNHRLKKN
jgi:four helix bundle protein